MVSDRLNNLVEYAFAEVKNKVQKLKSEGIVPIDFGVGDPTTPTPEFIRECCKEAIDKRKSEGYPSYVGSREYRKTVAEYCKDRFNIDLNPETEICSSIGSKEAIFNFPEAFINPGDYVIVPNPGYPPYSRGTIFAEGRVCYTNLLPENDFLPDLESIPHNIARQTNIIWVNYPNNPTTVTATKEFYKELIDFAQDYKIIIASDNAYCETYYDEKPLSILELEREGIVEFHSLSKRSNMTCWRVGWVMGDENIISEYKKLKTNIDSGTPTFIQDAASMALKDQEHVEKLRGEYKIKRDILIKAFSEMGLENCTPEATIYIWQKVPDNMNSIEFSKKLLSKDIAIVTTPGEYISETVDGTNPGEKYVRFALVPSIEECEEAANRLKNLDV